MHSELLKEIPKKFPNRKEFQLNFNQILDCQKIRRNFPKKFPDNFLKY